MNCTVTGCSEGRRSTMRVSLGGGAADMVGVCVRGGARSVRVFPSLTGGRRAAASCESLPAREGGGRFVSGRVFFFLFFLTLKKKTFFSPAPAAGAASSHMADSTTQALDRLVFSYLEKRQ